MSPVTANLNLNWFCEGLGRQHGVDGVFRSCVVHRRMINMYHWWSERGVPERGVPRVNLEMAAFLGWRYGSKLLLRSESSSWFGRVPLGRVASFLLSY